MSDKRYYYLSTGSKQGYYTLRVYWREATFGNGPNGAYFTGMQDRDEYIANLSTDRTLALRKAREYVAKRGGTLDTEVAFDLKEIQRRAAVESDPYRLDFSEHKGQTVDTLADTHPDFLIWLKHAFASTDPAKGRYVLRINELLGLGHAGLCAAEWEYTERQKSQALARVERQDARLAKFEAARYLGAIGEKLTLEVRITRIFTNEGQWGPTRTVLLRDADGNYLRTGGSGKDLLTLKQGRRYRIAATVKAHSRFDLKLDDKTEESVSVRQTQLERLKVLEDLGAAT